MDICHRRRLFYWCVFDFYGQIRTFPVLTSASLTGGAVCVLQVVQGGSSAQVPQANPLEYHLKAPQVPQGDRGPVPLASLVPAFAPGLPQVVLRLRRRDKGGTSALKRSLARAAVTVSETDVLEGPLESDQRKSEALLLRPEVSEVCFYPTCGTH